MTYYVVSGVYPAILLNEYCFQNEYCTGKRILEYSNKPWLMLEPGEHISNRHTNERTYEQNNRMSILHTSQTVMTSSLVNRLVSSTLASFPGSHPPSLPIAALRLHLSFCKLPRRIGTIKSVPDMMQAQQTECMYL